MPGLSGHFASDADPGVCSCARQTMWHTFMGNLIASAAVASVGILVFPTLSSTQMRSQLASVLRGISTSMSGCDRLLPSWLSSGDRISIAGRGLARTAADWLGMNVRVWRETITS